MYAETDSPKLSRPAGMGCQNQAPEYGVQSGLKHLNEMIGEAERLANESTSVLGISVQENVETNPRGCTLAENLREFAFRLDQANAKQRDALRHLAS